MDIRKLAEKNEEYIIKMRRWFHAHPELSYKEFETTARIKAELESMGLEVRTYPDYTGCEAVIEGGRSTKESKCVLLRADIDALPVKEETGLEFSSVNDGVMHACGHDTHIAMLLGAAKILCECRDELKGRVKMLFQAAEESCDGAKYYLTSGTLDGVDAGFAIHVMYGMNAPLLSVQTGPRMASCDNFKISVLGKNSHGSNPSEGADAIAAAAAIINNLQSIVSRRNDPRDASVVSIGKISGGVQNNIIANKVEMEGTCRTYNPEFRKRFEPLIRTITENTAECYGCKGILDFKPIIGVVDNCHEDINRIAELSARKLYGDEGIGYLRSVMSSEDFAFIMEKIPCFYAYVGAWDENNRTVNHNGDFVANESGLVRGAALYAQFAADYLEEK